MHPELALQLMRARHAELDRAARRWVRDHPRPIAARPASVRAGRPSPSLHRFARALVHWGAGRPGVAPAPPG